MKRKFKFIILLYKCEKPYMEFTFNTVNPMLFSQAYNLLYDKLRHDFPACLGYEFAVTSVSSEPCIDLSL
nr:MAG TPA: hypothetical protein [Microviridae sp.]